jgi:hypothetical protein
MCVVHLEDMRRMVRRRTLEDRAVPVFRRRLGLRARPVLPPSRGRPVHLLSPALLAGQEALLHRVRQRGPVGPVFRRRLGLRARRVLLEGPRHRAFQVPLAALHPPQPASPVIFQLWAEFGSILLVIEDSQRPALPAW